MSQTSVTDDVSLFQSSISFIGNGMTATVAEDGTIDEDLVLLRLNQLKMWQQTQQQILFDQQLSQRELLQQEKQKLYELFGLSMTSDREQGNDEGDDEEESSDPVTVKDIESTPATPRKEPRNLFHDKDEMILKSPPITLNMDKIVQNMAVRPVASAEDRKIPKQPFLKRGEGLKNRFKISPDAFRLNNLPKYKFARRAHASKTRQTRRHTEGDSSRDDAKTSAIPSTEAVTATEKLSGEGHQNNANQNRNFHVKASNASNRNANLTKPKRLSTELKLIPRERGEQRDESPSRLSHGVNAVTLVHPSNGKLNAIRWRQIRLLSAIFFVCCPAAGRFLILELYF